MPINRLKIEPFKKLELFAKKVVEGFITGMHKSPFHGFSVEFAEHRLYNKGESTRHIDWKLFARSGKLFVKRYEEETNLRCQIVIDISASMQFPKDSKNNKLNFSIYSAAALCELLKQQRDAFGLTLFENEIVKHFAPKGSPSHQKLIYNTLEEILDQNFESKKTSAAKALNQIAEIIHQRSLVIIFSDMFDNTSENEELFSALQHLKYRKHEVILFHVVDKSKEIDFEFDNKPYHFIDLESGEEIKLNPSQIKEQYQQSINQYKDMLKLKCGQYKIDFVEANINKGFDNILYTYLVKRNKMI
ncbi:MAG: DUF58 domain-containing protein [Bacteroidota bacterium]|nr:DUF58 domain-containing protein [Bacteroidota bacterium]MDP3144627.1 DUF58 domain-containing protein [Bacteroidota bacterium]MDP3556566.1 DUF58 domain-containing protein [Bacteroidota bacterium]